MRNKKMRKKSQKIKLTKIKTFYCYVSEFIINNNNNEKKKKTQKINI